jgi:hypothetical protein
MFQKLSLRNRRIVKSVLIKNIVFQIAGAGKFLSQRRKRKEPPPSADIRYFLFLGVSTASIFSCNFNKHRSW